MQYANHLVIQQLSEMEFVLIVNDIQLARELTIRLPPIGFAPYMKNFELMNNGKLEWHFKISGMDLDSFKRHITTFTPEFLNSLSSSYVNEIQS